MVTSHLVRNCSLEVFPLVDKTINRHAVSRFLNCGYFSAHETIYTSVKKLLPAHYLQWQPSKGIM